jgi:hypothetical protein
MQHVQGLACKVCKDVFDLRVLLPYWLSMLRILESYKVFIATACAVSLRNVELSVMPHTTFGLQSVCRKHNVVRYIRRGRMQWTASEMRRW